MAAAMPRRRLMREMLELRLVAAPADPRGTGAGHGGRHVPRRWWRSGTEAHRERRACRSARLAGAARSCSRCSCSCCSRSSWPASSGRCGWKRGPASSRSRARERRPRARRRLASARDLVERTLPESVDVVLTRMPPPVRLPGRAVGYAELTRIDTAPGGGAGAGLCRGRWRVGAAPGLRAVPSRPGRGLNRSRFGAGWSRCRSDR